MKWTCKRPPKNKANLGGEFQVTLPFQYSTIPIRGGAGWGEARGTGDEGQNAQNKANVGRWGVESPTVPLFHHSNIPVPGAWDAGQTHSRPYFRKYFALEAGTGWAA